jgi:hypothetical protein
MIIIAVSVCYLWLNLANLNVNMFYVSLVSIAYKVHHVLAQFVEIPFQLIGSQKLISICKRK